MPFGKVGEGEYGTYFIGYCRTPRVTEQMIENIVSSASRPATMTEYWTSAAAVTGTLFFVPSATFLDALGEGASTDENTGYAINGCALVTGRGVRRFAWNRPPQRRKAPMNNLHRELAPISDAAWAQIEEETRRTLKRYLAGRACGRRRGPGRFWSLRCWNRPHQAHRRAGARGSSRASARSSLWSNSGFPSSLTASRSMTSSGARTTRTGSRRRTPRRQSPMPRIALSSKGMRPLRLKASGRGQAIPS